VGAGPAAAEPGALYIALACETPALVGPLQTLISVAPAIVSQVVSIDVRPGAAAVLHHEERQSAATAAAGLAGATGRSAAPVPLAPYPRLLLRVVQRSGDGRRAETAAGVEHALHEEGKWVGVCARGGGTIALGDVSDGWRLQLSWVGGVPPLDVLSSYAVFLGRPGIWMQSRRWRRQLPRPQRPLKRSSWRHFPPRKVGQGPSASRVRFLLQLSCSLFLPLAPAACLPCPPCRERMLMGRSWLVERGALHPSAGRHLLPLTLSTRNTVQVE